MSPALNYKALLYATPTHLPSICPFTRPHVIISALSMHLPPVLWAWIRAPATHFLGARILTTLPLSIPPAAFSALPQHLPSPFSVIILSSQYLFQRGPIWIHITGNFCYYTPQKWFIFTRHFLYDPLIPQIPVSFSVKRRRTRHIYFALNISFSGPFGEATYAWLTASGTLTKICELLPPPAHSPAY